MDSLADLIRRLQQEDPETSDIFRTFAEVEEFYREAVQAAQGANVAQPAVKNSADVVISFRSTPSDSTSAIKN